MLPIRKSGNKAKNLKSLKTATNSRSSPIKSARPLQLLLNFFLSLAVAALQREITSASVRPIINEEVDTAIQKLVCGSLLFSIWRKEKFLGRGDDEKLKWPQWRRVGSISLFLSGLDWKSFTDWEGRLIELCPKLDCYFRMPYYNLE